MKFTLSTEHLSPVFVLSLGLCSRSGLGRLVNLSSSETLGLKFNGFLKAKSSGSYMTYKPKG